MSAVIGALRAVLSLESAAFTNGLKNAQGSLDRFAAQADRVAKRMQKVGTVLTAGITVPLAGLAVGIGKATQSINELGKLSKVANTSAQEFKELAIAGQEFGIGQEKMADILKDVNDKVGDFLATGAGPMADFFENIAPKVGITADAFKGLSGRDALQLYVSSLEKAGVSQQEMTFYMEALASDATALLPIFADNGKVLQDVAARARELGLAIDQDLVDGAGQMTRDWNIVREVLGVQLQQALVRLAPAFQEMMASVLPVIEKIMTAVSNLAEGFAGLPDATQDMIATGLAIGFAAGPILVGFGLAASAVSKLSDALHLLVRHPVLATIGLIGAGAWWVYENWDWVKGKMSDIWDAIKATAEAAWEGIKSAIGAAIDFVIEKWNQFIELLNSALEVARNVGTAISEALGLGSELEAQRDRMGLAYNSPESREKTKAGIYGEGYELGADLSQGLTDGLGAGLTTNGSEIRDYLGGVTDTARDEYGIKSPSRVFREIGQFLSQGLSLGMLDGKAGVEAASAELADSAKSGVEIAADSLEQSGKSLFREWVTGAKSASEALGGLAGRLADMLADSAFQSLFGRGGGLFGGIWDGLAGIFGFANGGVFRGGAVQAFADGGVVARATNFAMPGGRMGLMGEAGPEAIMPLTRGPGGRLGVEAHGGGRSLLVVSLSPDLRAEILEQAGDQAVEVVRGYDAEVAPASRRRNPREVG